jgi:hypothetical protein
MLNDDNVKLWTTRVPKDFMYWSMLGKKFTLTADLCERCYDTFTEDCIDKYYRNDISLLRFTEQSERFLAK